MWRILGILIFFSGNAWATAYHAVFGSVDTGNYDSADNACLALGAIIYPSMYTRPVTGSAGTPTSTQSFQCNTDVSYAKVGTVYWVDAECPDINEVGYCVLVCDDGLPPEAGELLGYGVTCDRPSLQQCDDGSYILLGQLCTVSQDPGICADYQTCYQYAFSNSSCAGSDYFEFTYQDPENFSFTCTAIAANSPDNPDNGGNGDGNPNNDPQTPTQENGGPTPIAELDVDSLANAIDDALENDFGNVERAVRQEGDSIETAIVNLDNHNQNDSGQVQQLLSDLIAQDAAQHAAEQAAKQAEDAAKGPCDPTQADYFDCITTTSYPAHTSAPSTVSAVMHSFRARVYASDVVAGLSSVAGLVQFSGAGCPAFTMDLPAPISTTVSTTLHCSLYNEISGVLSLVMSVVWVFYGFRIFASA